MDGSGELVAGVSALIAASIDGAGRIEQGAFAEVNEQLAGSFGYDGADALLGRSWTELYPKTERERIRTEVLPRVRDGEGWSGEVRGVRADGTTFPQLLSVRASGSEEEGLVWVVRDLSERNGGDVALDRTGSTPVDADGFRFQPLVETAPVPIVVFTAERGLVYANRKAVSLLGADDETDVLGHDPERFVHPEDRERANERIRRVIEERETTDPVEYRLVGLDERDLFVEIAAAPITYDGAPGAYVVINDVTSYQDSQAQLRREQQFVRTVLDTVDDVFYVIDENGESYLWNEALVETTGYSHEEIDAMHPMELIPEEQHEFVPGLMEALEAIEDRRVELDILTEDGERIPHEFKGTTFEDPETGEVFRCGVARNVTDRNRRERELERQRDELATLDRINRVLFGTVRELVRTADRDAVERLLCRRLVDSDLYQFAWVGGPAFDSDRIVPQRTAGDDRGFLDAIGSDTHSESDRAPAARAMRTGDVQVVDVSDSEANTWQRITSECGFESIAAVPLQYDGTVYGVLSVHTTRKNAFSTRERSDLDVLGRTIGTVISAIKSHKLLFADTVTELEFKIGETDFPVGAIAREFDCELRLGGYATSGGRWFLYFETDGATPEELIEPVAAQSAVQRARIVGGDDGSGIIEVILAESTVLDTFAHLGASIRTAVASPTGSRFVIEVPGGTEVRKVFEQIRNECPDTELLGQHEREDVLPAVGHPDGVLGRLTERQREVLEVAYRAGYFTWPRESTAEQLAASLDLSSATLHGHLRKAEHEILSALLDGD